MDSIDNRDAISAKRRPEPCSKLHEVLQTHKVILDTSFAMSEGFAQFYHDFADVLKQNPVLVPLVAKQELLKHLRNSDQAKSSAARKSLDCLDQMERHKSAVVRHEACDSFTDLVIQRVVEQHLIDYDFCVLTNDVGLMLDLHEKQHKHSVRNTKNLFVIKLHGMTHKPVQFTPYAGTWAPSARRATRPASPQPFTLASALQPDLEKPLVVRETIKEGSSLFVADGSVVKLEREIAGGGEGSVFEIAGRADVCKIYHENRITVGRENKLALMTSRGLDEPGICWPTDVVRDSNGVFRGFIMPRARGYSLRETLFVPKLFLKENPNWTRRESVNLAIQILEKIQLLHSMNVIIGDVNELNILMVDDTEMYFVDCDSYQLEGYPCPVGTVNFTAPEIQGCDFRTFLRTKDNELYAVATLLFMILHPGKCPYSHQGGEDGATNIKEAHFPYPLGQGNPTDGAPLGCWRFCWSHLSYRLKDAFYGSFHRDHLRPQRVGIWEWLNVLREYQNYLSDPGKTFMGPSRHPGFDLSILPQNYRRVPGQDDPVPSEGETDLGMLKDRIWLNNNKTQSRARLATSVPPRTPRPTKSRPLRAGGANTVPHVTGRPRQVRSRGSNPIRGQIPTLAIWVLYLGIAALGFFVIGEIISWIPGWLWGLIAIIVFAGASKK
jgi:hypothetical protein